MVITSFTFLSGLPVSFLSLCSNLVNEQPHGIPSETQPSITILFSKRLRGGQSIAEFFRRRDRIIVTLYSAHLNLRVVQGIGRILSQHHILRAFIFFGSLWDRKNIFNITYLDENAM